MKNYISESFLKILAIFFIWRFILILILIFAINFINLGYKDRFLGGGSINYSLSPQLFSWANFDGEHYLSIAIHGYKGLEQAFFPVYPIMISFFAKPFSKDSFSLLVSSTIVGIIISNAAFLLSLFFLWELIKKDYGEKIAYLTLISIVLFPTSFYFGAVYNESLFLLLTVLSFYFARQKRWFLASLSGLISSAARIFGLLLLPALAIEVYQQKTPLSKVFWILFIPLGLGIYMIYQNLTVGDPFAYYHLQKIVGEQHQGGLTILPQVYFRYVKMLLTVDISNPIYQTILLEFVVGIVFFILPIYGYFKKIRLSYLAFAMLGFLMPTIQGSFSSVPRYVLVFFPSFLAAALWISGLSRLVKLSIFIALLLLLILETALFLRGYWIA